MGEEHNNLEHRLVPSAWQVSQLLAHGLSIEELAEHLSLDPVKLCSPTLMLSTRAFQNLLEWGAARLNATDFGVGLGLSITDTEFGLVGYVAKSAPTLGASLELIAKYHDLYAADSVISLRRQGDHLFLEYLPNRVAGIEPVQDIYFSLALTVTHVRRHIDPRFVPHETRFAFGPRALTPVLTEAFGTCISFDHPVSSIAIPVQLAGATMPHSDTTLLDILIQQADQMMNTVEHSDGLRQRLSLLIAGNLHDPDFNADVAASALNMSSRQMHRALAKRGVNYRDLRDQAFQTLAREALTNSDVPITDIAHRLGYAETSSFSRSFRRIAGVSPSVFRKNAVMRSDTVIVSD